MELQLFRIHGSLLRVTVSHVLSMSTWVFFGFHWFPPTSPVTGWTGYAKLHLFLHGAPESHHGQERVLAPPGVHTGDE